MDPEAPTKTLFNVVRVGAVCAECAAGDTPWMCQHCLADLPSWRSADKVKRLKVVYEGDPDSVMNEFGGEDTCTARYRFPEAMIKLLANREHFLVTEPPRAIYVGIDPTGGGPSELAVTAMADVGQGRLVVRTYVVVVCY